MPFLDWVWLAVMLISMLLGFMRGLVYEAISFTGWVLAVLSALALAQGVGNWLPIEGASETVRQVVGFVIVFILVAFVAGLLAFLLRRAIRAIGLRGVDRVLGGAFGVLRGVVAMMLVVVAAHLLNFTDSPLWRASLAVPWLEAGLANIKPSLPASVAGYLPRATAERP